jgi:hypothetical protein
MAPEVVENSVASSQNMHIGHERVVAIPGEPPGAAKKSHCCYIRTSSVEITDVLNLLVAFKAASRWK